MRRLWPWFGAAILATLAVVAVVPFIAAGVNR